MDTQVAEEETAEEIVRLEIDRELCKGCELCVPFCPKEILFMSDKFNSKGYRYVEITSQAKCNSCQMCAIMCPDLVFTVWRVKRGK